MEIIRAKTAGFCFGVDRAVKLTYDLLAQGRKVATLGPAPQLSRQVFMAGENVPVGHGRGLRADDRGELDECEGAANRGRGQLDHPRTDVAGHCQHQVHIAQSRGRYLLRGPLMRHVESVEHRRHGWVYRIADERVGAGTGRVDQAAQPVAQ